MDYFISGLPEMWIETLQKPAIWSASTISSLDYQRCGLKQVRFNLCSTSSLFHLWITRDVD